MTKYIDRYYLNGEEYGIKFGGGGWQPGTNTIAYYPLEKDTNDYSGNNRNATSIGSSVSFTTYDGYNCASFTGDSNSYIRYGDLWSSLSWSNGITINFWIGDVTVNTSGGNAINGILQGKWNSNSNNIVVGIYSNGGDLGKLTSQIGVTNQYFSDIRNLSGMHLITIIYRANGTISYYIDGVSSGSGSYSIPNYSWDKNCMIGWNERDTDSFRHLTGKLRQVVLENGERTTEQIQLFYDATK